MATAVKVAPVRQPMRTSLKSHAKYTMNQQTQHSEAVSTKTEIVRASQRFGTQAQSQTGRVTTETLSAGWQSRTVQEALDEVARELGVRERLYAKWVFDGKHTETDAADRMQRMIMAAALLDQIVKNAELAKQISCQLATQWQNS